MAFFFSGDEHFRGLSGDEAYRAYLITRGPQAAAVHSGRTEMMRLAVHARRAAGHIDAFALKAVKGIDRLLHRAISALAESKIRRIQRELALRGVRYDRTTTSATEARE